MKKLLIPILIIAGLSACQKKKGMSDAMIKAQVDSLVELRMKDINQWAKEDLEQRTTIELRARMDSIVEAREASDTAKSGRVAADTVQSPQMEP